MGDFNVDERSLQVGLKRALSPEEYQDVKDAPYEWLVVMYSDRIRFGVNHHDVKSFLEKVIPEYRTLRFLFESEYYRVAKNEHITLLLERLRNNGKANPPVNPAKTLLLEAGIFDIYGITWLSNMVTLLQNRHHIADGTSYLKQEDYDFLSSGLRTHWGRIHPDDKEILQNG